MRAVLAHIVHDRERHGRLAATRFADDPMRLAGHQRQIEIDDGRDLAGPRVVGDREIAAFEDGVVRRCRTRIALLASQSLQAHLAQPVGDQVEAEDEARNRQRRESSACRQNCGDHRDLGRLLDHQAPIRIRRLQAQAEESQRGDGDRRIAEPQTGIDDDRSARIGQQLDRS